MHAINALSSDAYFFNLRFQKTNTITMPAVKRFNTGDTETSPQPAKRSKRKDAMPSSDPLLTAEARIHELEQHVKDLHDWINDSGMTRKAPQHIRNYINTQPGAATILAKQIRSAARQISSCLSDKALNYRRTGITSDHISQAMMPFLSEVKDLRELPDSTAMAFDLVMDLAGYSYGHLDSAGSGEGDEEARPSDEVVDELLCELAVERRRDDPSWDFGEPLQLIRKRNNDLSPFGINNLCAGTDELLSGWQDGIATPEVVSKAVEKPIRRGTQAKRRSYGRNKATFAATVRGQALARKEKRKDGTA